MSRIPRYALAGVAAAALMGVASYLINEVWLGAAHDRHTFFRPDDHALRLPGLPITSLVWGVLLAVAYAQLGRRLPGRTAAIRGARFGALVFALLVGIHEVFYFQFIAMSPWLLVGGLLHYLVSYVGAGALVAVIVGDEAGGVARPHVA